MQDNLLHGRFLAELTKEVFHDLEETKYQHTEYRISIYGRKTVEWDILAAWVCQNKLYSDNNVWLIQVWHLKLQCCTNNIDGCGTVTSALTALITDRSTEHSTEAPSTTLKH